jgi:hypothetical protein
LNREQLLEHAKDVRESQAQFPGMNITEAYIRYKKGKGETPRLLSSLDQRHIDAGLKFFTTRSCTRSNCTGTMHLEPICPSCVEGKAGYNSKWTCDTCLDRDLSKKDFSDWFTEEKKL